ncbi:MAG: SDR family oxidoreductase [Candidatus Omnitrophica bacterium]|nr:SDR family oxidoreductase [Candidatus Omnitrophota bacterium]
MKRLLITGGSGLLGSNLAMIARNEFDTYLSYNTHKISMRKCHCEQIDLVNYEKTKNLVAQIKPEYIIHCAALVDVDYCEKHPIIARRNNFVATKNIAEIAEKNKAKLVYISTDAVFDGNTGMYKESDKTSPLSVYAKTKLEGENIVRAVSTNHMIVRTCVYGWSLAGTKNFAEWVYCSLKEKRPINMFTDIFFTPILANDLSDMLIKALAKDLRGVYNMTGSQVCRKLDFAVQMADLFGFDKKCINSVSSESTGSRAPRPKNSSLDTTKVSAKLNIAIPDLLSGLKRFKYLLEQGYVSEMRSYFVGG